MRCDFCNKTVKDTKRFNTVYGWINMCPKCREMYENRPIKDKTDRGEGYLPDHDGTMYFTCPKCGCGEFDTFPQTIPANRDVRWTYEYQCVRCKAILGLTLRGSEEL